jgi:hypothetical protein
MTQQEYEKNLKDCQRKLHGRLVLCKGDKPYTSKEVAVKLLKIWKTKHHWRVMSLGRGFYEFTFGSVEDLRTV